MYSGFTVSVKEFLKQKHNNFIIYQHIISQLDNKIFIKIPCMLYNYTDYVIYYLVIIYNLIIVIKFISLEIM